MISSFARAAASPPPPLLRNTAGEAFPGENSALSHVATSLDTFDFGPSASDLLWLMPEADGDYNKE